MATSEQDKPTLIQPSRKIALVSGCTMKEYDQQISDLKKENFSLKLRIYYTEERLQQTFGDGQDVFKMNVQLQTEVDSLKQELIDKQVLIQKAAFAIETLTANRDEEGAIRHRLRTDYEKQLTQLRDQLDKANESRDVSHSEVNMVRKEVEMLKQQLNDTTKELTASNKTNESLVKNLEEMKLEKTQKDALLDRYKKSVEGLVKTLHQKNEECEGLRERVDESSEQILLLQTVVKETELQSSKHLCDMKLLMEFLHKEMKSLAVLRQKLKDNTGEDKNIKAWLSEATSIQRVYQKLQKLVENNSQLDQTLMHSVPSRQANSDNVENSSNDGHNKLEPVFQIPRSKELASSQGEEQSGLGSLQQTSIDNGKSSDQTRVVFFPGKVSGRPTASSSALNEASADDVDSFLQSDVILSNINWWLQMPTMLEGEDGEKLLKVRENVDLNQAQKSPSDHTGENGDIEISSVDLVTDFRRDNPEVNISGVEEVKKLKRGNLEMVSSVDSSEDLRTDNQEKMNVPSLDSHKELRGNLVDNLRNVSEGASVNTGNVIANPIASPHCSKSLAADSKEELFGTYSESLDNFHKFQHAAFFDEDQFDFCRHDRASSVKLDSQNATLNGRTVSEQMTSTHNSHWNMGDSNPVSSKISDSGSLLQAEEAQGIQQPAGVNQNMVGSQRLAEIDQNILGSQQPANLEKNIIGTQHIAEVDENIIGNQQLVNNQNLCGNQVPTNDQNILLGSQQPTEANQNMLGSQHPMEGNQNIFSSQQPSEVNQNILSSQHPTEVDQKIFSGQQPTDVNQNMLGCQDNANVEVNTQIKDLEEKLKATENTVKLLSRKNKVYLSVLKAAGVCVNFMNRSNSESCLGSLSASSDKRVSSVGSLNMSTPGPNNESIERPRSFICDTFTQSGDVTCDSLTASIVATPARTAVSLMEDASRIYEMSAEILNHTTQSCTGNVNPTEFQSHSAHVSDHCSNTNSNNHNTSCVGNNNLVSILTFPASPPASLTCSMGASPHKQQQHHDISLSSERHRQATAIPNCLYQFGGQDHTFMDTHDRSYKCEHLLMSSLNMAGVNEKRPPNVTYSIIVDRRSNHRASLDERGVSQDKHLEITNSSIMDNTLTNHEVESNMDMDGARHPNPPDPSIMDNTLMNDKVQSNMDMSGVSQRRHPDVTFSSVVGNPLMTHGVRSSMDVSGVSRGRSPDVTFSSIMDGSLMNRLLDNLEHSLSAFKDDTWNFSDLSVGQLRNHVEHLERVNLALKEEIRVYETLHCLQTTQVHPRDQSLSQSQTDQELSEQNHLKPCSKRKKIPVLSEEDLLRQYLIEIKKIRQRLERLDLGKDPDQLLIFQSHTQQRIVHQETVIAHLQQLMVEKETQWQQQISELQHKLSRGKVVAVEKLECTISQLQATVRDQAEAIRQQEKQIVDYKLCLEQSERNIQRKEEVVRENALEAQLMHLNTTCFGEGKRLDDELEAKQKEIERLKVELGKERESWRHLKEIVVKRERSLQEKILALQKLTSEKALVEDTVKDQEAEIRNLELELDDLREKFQGMKVALEDRTMLVDKLELLKEELRERENQEVRYDFQKMRYDAEIEKITEEKVKLSMDLETESREKERLKLRLRELEHKVLEGVKLERQNRELKGEMKSLLSEVDKLNTKLDHRVVQEMEIRNRLRMRGEVESEVSELREQLLKCEDSLRVAQQLHDGAVKEVNEREERLKKRNEQLHHLLQQYKKLEAAFIKQKSKLKERTDLLQKLKKQIHLHEHNLTSSSDPSLNDTNLCLDSENFPDSAFTSTPRASAPVKQHSDIESLKPCRRQLTYSTAEIQPPGNFITSASDSCCPVAILSQDCHHRLYQKTEECLLILTEIESRLRVHKTNNDSENKEYSILRETYTSCQRLDYCLREASSWISVAWITELPNSQIQAPNYHPVMGQQNGNLRNEIQQLPSRGSTSQALAQQQNQSHKNHKTWEKNLYKQLFKTTQDLEKAKEKIDTTLNSLLPPPAL